jgi:hypothetical protein
MPLLRCAEDGLIFKPERPAVSLDMSFRNRVNSTMGPTGQVWSTYSTVPAGRRSG